MELYKVAFYGDLAPNADLETVQNNLATLFKTDIKRIKAMFSGDEVTIKTKIDNTTAEKYRIAMLKAGAVAHVINISTQAMPQVEEITAPNDDAYSAQVAQANQTTTPTTAKVAAQTNQIADNNHPHNTDQIRNFLPTKKEHLHQVGIDSSNFAPLNIQPKDGYTQAFINVKAPNFGVVELGNHLQDPTSNTDAPQLDLSKFSLSPDGADLEQLTKDETIEIPDVSHLKVE